MVYVIIAAAVLVVIGYALYTAWVVRKAEPCERKKEEEQWGLDNLCCSFWERS